MQVTSQHPIFQSKAWASLQSQAFQETHYLEEYKLSFGDDTAMPNCTCYDWRHSAYLCKHFFAVFNVFPNWSWEALSPVYRISPFMTLDEEIQQHRSREILQDFEDSEQPDSQDDQDVLRHELGNDSSSSQQSPKSHEKCCGPL